MTKYRVLWTDVNDGHVREREPHVLFESDELYECYNYVVNYIHDNPEDWSTLYVQELKPTYISIGSATVDWDIDDLRDKLFSDEAPDEIDEYE